MSDVLLMKTPAGALVPIDSDGVEYIAGLKVGQSVRAKITKANNVAFHRKLFALFNFAYEQWEPEEKMYKGEIVQKNFDQFRKDITILAGYYQTVVNLKGEVRVVAQSLSFGAMDQGEREKLYGSVISVILQKVLRQYTRPDLDHVIDQLLEGFA